ncbi:MAG: 23S rRNA (guanosine(2251)-2'-O)-methyltransferase RlmB [bacterium]
MPLIKGRQAVHESLLAKQKPHRIMICHEHRGSQGLSEILELAKRFSIPIQRLDRQQFVRLADDKHQQVLAHMPELRLLSLRELIAKSPPLIVILDHIEDPHNMGAIFRSCEALGHPFVIFPKHRSSPIGTGSIRSSAGAIWHLNLCQVSNISQSLRELKKKGYWIYAASEHEGTSLTHVDLCQPAVLLLGNEHKGISPIHKKMVDFFIEIPLSGQVSSLNVSVAAGIILYTFSNQRIS